MTGLLAANDDGDFGAPGLFEANFGGDDEEEEQPLEVVDAKNDWQEEQSNKLKNILNAA